MVGGQPVEELRRLVGRLRGLLRRLPPERLGDLGEAREHRLPVLDRGADLGEDLVDVMLEPREPLGIADLVDLHLDAGFADAVLVARLGEALAGAVGLAVHGDDRVHQRVDSGAPLVQERRERIHEERHVVVDDLEHGVRRLPAVLGHARVVEADLGLAGLALGGELPERERGAVDVLGLAVDHLLGRGLGVEALERLGEGLVVRLAQPSLGKLAHRGELGIQPLQLTFAHPGPLPHVLSGPATRAVRYCPGAAALLRKANRVRPSCAGSRDRSTAVSARAGTRLSRSRRRSRARWPRSARRAAGAPRPRAAPGGATPCRDRRRAAPRGAP